MKKIPSDTTLSFMPLGIGLLLLAGTGMALYTAVTSARKTWGKPVILTLVLAAASAWFLWMSSTLFPWNYVSKVTSFFDHMQFAWRFLTIPTVLLSLTAAYGVLRMTGRHEAPSAFLLLILCAAMVLPTLDVQTRREPLYEFGEDTTPDIKDFGEYCLDGVDTFISTDREASVSDGISLTGYEKKGLRITAKINAQADGILSLPLFAFTGYEADIDGETLDLEREENGRLDVCIPAGMAGTLTVRYVGKWYWIIGNAVTVLTLVGLFLVIRKQKSLAV